MNKATKGFTLIELLVVITIIGILATWAVAIFTSQIQKSRDSTRINDVKALQAAVEQAYQDSTEYPFTWATLSWSLKKYMQKVPSDPKSKQTCWAWTQQTTCDYLYTVSSDTNGIAYAIYELSTWFENDANRTSKASKTADNWNDDNRMEVWLDIGTLNTSWTGAIAWSWCTLNVPSANLTKIGWECN